MTRTDGEIQRLREVYQGYAADDRYDRQWSELNSGNQAIVAERDARIAKMLERAGFIDASVRDVLEIGCGTGQTLSRVPAWGITPGRLVGLDVLEDPIDIARLQFPELEFIAANAESLPLKDASFDLVLAFTVFSSILDRAMAHNVASEMARVLKPGGAILWYDVRIDNPRNPNVHGITVRDLRDLFPRFSLDIRSVTVVPPLARKLGRWAPIVYPVLAAVPFLRTHYVALLSNHVVLP